MGESGQKRPKSITVETFDGRIKVEWEPEGAVTALGQLPFFIEFLKTAELFDSWVEDCPLSYESPNAPAKRDVLGTILLSVLSGHRRYAHISAIRSDGVNPELLGMKKVCSEDSVRRAIQRADEEKVRDWQWSHLKRCYEPLLSEPWVLDIDTPVKPLYGHQEGAVVGFNPHKPGRPSHVYHTYFVANLRLVLDVSVQPGNEASSKYSRGGLFCFLDGLDRKNWPSFLRGDSGFGNEETMKEAEARELPYLFKLRQTKGVKQLIEKLFRAGPWKEAGQGWEGMEGSLRLSGWSRERRVVILRRVVREEVENPSHSEIEQLEFDFVTSDKYGTKYEYAVLVTSLPGEVLSIAQHYRDRADAENAFDELKNQWGWCGFTTRELKRCQIMARHIALIYNWWSLFVRLAVPGKHAEAITSRPLLLSAIGRKTSHAGQTKLKVTNLHANAQEVSKIFYWITSWLKGLRKNAEQLPRRRRWEIILSQIFVDFLKGRVLGNQLQLGFST